MSHSLVLKACLNAKVSRGLIHATTNRNQKSGIPPGIIPIRYQARLKSQKYNFKKIKKYSILRPFLIDTILFDSEFDKKKPLSSMGSFISPIVFCLILCSCMVGAISTFGNQDVNKGSISNVRIYRSSIDRYIDKLFDETDTNEDGMVSFDEAYVGCLLLYVRLNRRAPIPPPSRKKFLRIFLKHLDTKGGANESYLLDKEEYGDILKRIVARAMLRLTSHKIVTILGAPLLTEVIVRSMASRKDGVEATMRFIVPCKFHDAVIPTVTSKAFHRGFWTIILVMTLGNICVAAVTFLLDMSLPESPMSRLQKRQESSLS